MLCFGLWPSQHCYKRLCLQGMTELHQLAAAEDSALNYSVYKPMCIDSCKEVIQAGVDINASDSKVKLPLLHFARGSCSVCNNPIEQQCIKCWASRQHSKCVLASAHVESCIYMICQAATLARSGLPVASQHATSYSFKWTALYVQRWLIIVRAYSR